MTNWSFMKKAPRNYIKSSINSKKIKQKGILVKKRDIFSLVK